MYNKSEKRLDRWQKLSELPDNVIKNLDALLQVVKKESSYELFQLLSDCDTNDICRLTEAKGNVSDAYANLKQETDDKDSVLRLQKHFIENPVHIIGELTGISSGIQYNIKVEASNMRKVGSLNRGEVTFALPCTITLKYKDKYVTVQHMYTQSINKKAPNKIDSMANLVLSGIKNESVSWPFRGCKRSGLRRNSEKVWFNCSLDVLHMLEDHPIYVKFIEDTSELKHFDLAFAQFDVKHLPFVRKLMSLHSNFSHELQEGNSIAFLYNTDTFHVFTERDGIFYDDRRSGQSVLFERLELAEQLTK